MEFHNLLISLEFHIMIIIFIIIIIITLLSELPQMICLSLFYNKQDSALCDKYTITHSLIYRFEALSR